MGRQTANFTGLALNLALVLVGVYFGLSAVQGNSGLFQRLEIESKAEGLRAELAALEAETARKENLTRRLSDHFLDLDLLDQQAREILGYARSDEIIIR